MIGLDEFALGVIYELLAGVIVEGVNYTLLPYFQRRKIESRILDATAEVVEPLLPFLSNEGISGNKQKILIQTCVDELHQVTEKPELLFQGSLNGQMIFDNLYKDRELPQAIVDEDLKEIYGRGEQRDRNGESK